MILNASPDAFELRSTSGVDHYLSKGLKIYPENIESALRLKTFQDYFHPFACITHDPKSGEVTLIRDHLGMQPLYYYYQFPKLIFAESIPEILNHLDRPPHWNEDEIQNLFALFSRYSDQTIYKDIYRVEPGHLIHVTAQGKIKKSAYWSLRKDTPYLNYRNDDEYVEHFDSLLREAVQVSCKGHDSIAAEFSAGIDSSAIVAAALSQKIRPRLYMHTALPESKTSKFYNRSYEEKFLSYYGAENLHIEDAQDFDPLKTFQAQARLFAGPSPHLFTMFAEPVHSAVSQNHHPILLSGFGGDQGVSGHVPNSVVPRTLWASIFQKMRNPFFKRAAKVPFDLSSLRNLEWDLLQGPYSHEIRMRIEYSSLVAKARGFEYRYPLLYPKLLEFYLATPLIQKKRNGTGRHLIRRYLAKKLGSPFFDSYQKKEGLHIMPAALDTFKKRFGEGEFKNTFENLPFPNHNPAPSDRHISLIHSIKAYMLKVFSEQIKT